MYVNCSNDEESRHLKQYKTNQNSLQSCEWLCVNEMFNQYLPAVGFYKVQTTKFSIGDLRLCVVAYNCERDDIALPICEVESGYTQTCLRRRDNR